MAWTLCCWGILTSVTLCPVVSSSPQRQVPEARATAPHAVIKWRADCLSVSAREAPWEEVLNELQRQTGVRIQVKGSLAGTLTQEFEALPLEQGLRRLFRRVNTAFFYAPDPHVGSAAAWLTQVWLWPREGRTVEERPMHTVTGVTLLPQRDGASPAASTSDGDLAAEAAAEDQEEHLKVLDTLAQRGDEGALRQALFDLDRTVQERALQALAARDQQGTIAFLSDMARSAEPAMRVEALALLHESGYADEPTVLPILHAALADADVTVKGYAIQALADRGGDEAIGALRQALSDPDPIVRLQVVDHVAPYDQGRALLQESLADEDDTVRSVATAKLEEAVSEGR